MTKQPNWHKLSQEITCEGCDKVVPRMTHNQRFCSTKCQQQNYKTRLFTKKCKVCNEKFQTRTKKTVVCSSFCSKVYTSVNQQKYSDKELIHLVLINKGYGFTRFCEKLNIIEDRLMFLSEFCQEEEKIDLFGILQDPDGLIIMRKDEWIAKGKPAKPVGGGQKGMTRKKTADGTNRRFTEKEMLETYRRYEQSGFVFDRYDIRTSVSFKVYPEFNWGPYGPRKAKRLRRK